MKHAKGETHATERGSSREWHIANLIDFEIALEKFEDSKAEDRSVFVKQIAPTLGERINDRSAVLLAWLKVRIPDAVSTGSQFQLGIRYSFLLVVLFGLLIGVATTAGLVSNERSQPINAASFFAVTVGLQLGVIALVIAALIARKFGFNFSPLTSAMKGLVLFIAKALNLLNGEQRTQVRYFFAKTGSRSERLGPLIGLQLFQMTQAFAIAFNLAILGSMLLYYLPFSELRFGWQTTYTFVPAQVFKFVQGLAIPWRWISDALAPSMQQVLATQLARGQSALSLNTSSVHAWWPFLLCAVGFYGLLPRLIVLVALEGRLRWHLRHIQLNHFQANALVRRLQPTVEPGDTEDWPPEEPASDRPRPALARNVLTIKSDVGTLSDEQVADCIQRSTGRQVKDIISSCIDDDNLSPSLVAALQALPDEVIIVTPAAQDPIVAIAGFVKKLSASGKPDGEVIVLLTGGAGSDLDSRLKIWQRFVTVQKLKAAVELCQ